MGEGREEGGSERQADGGGRERLGWCGVCGRGGAGVTKAEPERERKRKAGRKGGKWGGSEGQRQNGR